VKWTEDTLPRNMQEELLTIDLLGLPLPPHEAHSVSVSLPLWKHVCAYEEGQIGVINSLQSGYPRFRFHNAVQGLFTTLRAIYFLERINTNANAVQVKGPPSTDQAITNVQDIEVSCMVFHGLAVANRFKNFLVSL
jgi:hypothetical protein